MAITSAGYAGTVNDLQWAQMARYFGMDYAAKTAADIACTQNGANKNFNIAAGEFWGRGIMDVNSAIVNVAPAVPAAGQWFLIVARRVWATKVTSFVAVASSTTTTATPTATPAAYPAINTNPGVTDDQPLYWVWINSANTTTVVVDIRRTADSYDTITASSDMQRNAKFQSPVAGDRVKRTDLRIIERYYSAAEAVTPGWYPAPGEEVFIHADRANGVTINNTTLIAGFGAAGALFTAPIGNKPLVLAATTYSNEFFDVTQAGLVTPKRYPGRYSAEHQVQWSNTAVVAQTHFTKNNASLGNDATQLCGEDQLVSASATAMLRAVGKAISLAVTDVLRLVNRNNTAAAATVGYAPGWQGAAVYDLRWEGPVLV